MRTLIIRMSSLGDLILSTAFLENLPEGIRVDWVVSREFEFVLRGHPKIAHLHVFDKKSGLRGWYQLCRRLHRAGHESRVDLHRTLRSRLAMMWFRWWDLKQGVHVPHRGVPKQRLRTLLVLILKSACPSRWRPEPYWRRFGLLARTLARKLGPSPSPGASLRPPSFQWMLPSEDGEKRILQDYDLVSRGYVAVMPASRWSSKEWGLAGYLRLLTRRYREQGEVPLVLGRRTDGPCLALVEALKQEGIPVRHALDEADFGKTGVLLKHARFYLGSDTGLAHLAEAVGTRSRVIFGPTRPELGFGPWRPESLAISLPLACAPCSKDGKTCFRLTSPYLCMRGLSPDAVAERCP